MAIPEDKLEYLWKINTAKDSHSLDGECRHCLNVSSVSYTCSPLPALRWFKTGFHATRSISDKTVGMSQNATEQRWKGGGSWKVVFSTELSELLFLLVKH